MSIRRLAVSCAGLLLLAWAMLTLSAHASAAMFGLWLSIAAWALVLGLGVLPAAAYRRWRARRIAPGGGGPWG
jgi:hypothetical protein